MIGGHCRTTAGEGNRNTCGPLVLIAVLVLGAVFCGGCASKDFAGIRPGIESRGHYIGGVPFYQQSESTCGPAALASVFAF